VLAAQKPSVPCPPLLSNGGSRQPRRRSACLRNAPMTSLRVCAPRQTTCVELMTQMGRTRAFVAWAMDDGALPPDEGPLRIVVTSDL